MRKRIKYKVGDIIELWDVNDLDAPTTENYIIIGVEDGFFWSHRNPPDEEKKKFYMLKHMSTGDVIKLHVDRVDMRKWGRYSRLCREGWRRVG